MITIRKLIRKFVAVQSDLLRAFSKTEQDRSGELECNGILWKWQRHGVGVSFTNRSNGVVVDAHKYVEEPNYIDAWRLSYYMETQGITKILVNDVIHSIDNYRDLNAILDELCETKFLSPAGNNHFKVSILSIVHSCED